MRHLAFVLASVLPACAGAGQPTPSGHTPAGAAVEGEIRRLEERMAAWQSTRIPE